MGLLDHRSRAGLHHGRVSLFAIDGSPDPAVHRAGIQIANRVVFLIRPLLRGAGDRDLALREAYAIARAAIERHGPAGATGHGGAGQA
jgi:hypothetical protein